MPLIRSLTTIEITGFSSFGLLIHNQKHGIEEIYAFQYYYHEDCINGDCQTLISLNKH